uniref:Holocytochrome c-type synthase n=1 Tax=Lotharella oceanica TaxID=641309 RepID=A0A7S2TXD0_9EUKA
MPSRNAQGAVAPRSRSSNTRARTPFSRVRMGSPVALPKPRMGPMFAQRKASQVERTIDAWKQAGASAALGFFIALGANLGPGASLALAAEGGKAIAEQINMDALKEMTKDAMDKGYDQKWVDEHLAQMEARGYDIEWVQQHLGTVMEDMKKKAEVDPNNMMFKDLNEGKSPKQLESERVVSSIPRTSVDGLPSHQEGLEGIDQWVYPSPKMFWNAMDRKGKHPERYNPEDISGVVRIHNFVNEKAWNEILKWEDMHASECPSGPSLTSFKGKYDKLSGKGFLNKYVPIPGALGAPFDRHDWVINRCGKTVRYVLDYYKDENMQEEPKIRLDVRPAPDSVDNLMDWMRYGSFSKENAKAAKIVTFEQTTQMRTADQVLKELNEGPADQPTSS